MSLDKTYFEQMEAKIPHGRKPGLGAECCRA